MELHEIGDRLLQKADVKEKLARHAVVDADRTVKTRERELATLESELDREERALLAKVEALPSAWLVAVAHSRTAGSQTKKNIQVELVREQRALEARRREYAGACSDRARAENVATKLRLEWRADLERRLQDDLEDTAQSVRIATDYTTPEA